MNKADKKNTLFNTPSPVIFAHRGGAAEAPESTIDGFLHGLRHGAHVLEFDVQLTKDGVPIIWHGPKLDIAFNQNEQYQKKIKVWDLSHQKISSTLWVNHPNTTDDSNKKRQSPERRIISLAQLLEFVTDAKQGKYGTEWQDKPIHLNIELKTTRRPAPSWTQKQKGTNATVPDSYPYLHNILKILEQKPEDTNVIVGSASQKILSRFREVQNGSDYEPHRTMLSLTEQVAYSKYFNRSHLTIPGKIAMLSARLFQVFVKEKANLADYAFETPSALVTPDLVNEVHVRNGRIYAFLSPFPLMNQPEKTRDTVKSDTYRQRVKYLLEIGVDGLMTDYPEELEKTLNSL